jgi:hypothetical protein
MRRSFFIGFAESSRRGDRAWWRHALPLLSFTLAVLPGLARAEPPAIVFVSRSLGDHPDPASRTYAVERADAGKLIAREPTGALRVLVDAAAGIPDGAPVDVMDPDVSYDGARIVFSGYAAAENGWRLFEIAADGSGLRKLTHSDRTLDLARFGGAAAGLAAYDDLDPCYLPDGRICFVSTRYAETAPDGRRQSTNLFIIDAGGGNLHRITSERFGADTPAVDPATGLVVYSRWWRTAQITADPTDPPPEPIPPGSPGYGDIVIDESNLVLRGIREEEFPGVNSWFLSSIRPDGTEMVMFSGFRLDRQATQAYRPSFLPAGEVVGLFIPVTPFIGYPRGNGLRRFERGPSRPTALGGPQTFPSQVIIDVVEGDVLPPPPPPEPPPRHYYASAAGLADGRILVSAAPAASIPDYGIYIQNDAAEDPVLVYNPTGTAELDAVPLAARTVPPVIADKALTALPELAPRTAEEAFATGGSFTFLCENIFANAGVGVAMPNAPPIGKRLAIEFFMAPQRTSPFASDPPILVGRQDIPPAGRIEMILPAGVPLFEVLRRPDNSIALGRDGQIFHVGGMNFGRAGEVNRCVGCHAGHSQMAVAEDPSWTNVAPSAMVTASSVFQIVDDVTLSQSANLVDRQTDLPRWWVAGDLEASAKLVWSTSIRAREVVVYGVPASPPDVDLTVGALTLRFFSRQAEVFQAYVPGPIRPEGTRAAVPDGVDFNTLSIAIRAADVSGRVFGTSVAALTEVEVIGKAVGEPSAAFVRGDVDCSGNINITDPIRILVKLFRGGAGFCCTAAADTNDDGTVNISDAIFPLNFLFLGGRPIPAPFPQCDSHPASMLDCEMGTCPGG